MSLGLQTLCNNGDLSPTLTKCFELHKHNNKNLNHALVVKSVNNMH